MIDTETKAAIDTLSEKALAGYVINLLNDMVRHSPEKDELLEERYKYAYKIYHEHFSEKDASQ